MAALVALVALGLMAYVPGRFLLRLLLPPGAEPRGGRLLYEMLLGNAAVGLLGFLLAEIGRFSLPAVLAGIAGLTGAAALARRAAGRPYSAADLAGIGLVAAAIAWAAPAFDTSLFGHDSSVYIAGGVTLARHGSLPFVDDTVAAIPRLERAEFFPSYGRRAGQAPYLRVPGGLLLSSLDDPVVLPAFHHLLSVWVALAYEIGGDDALSAPATYFAALAVWSLAAFSFVLGGGATTLFFLVLLAVSVPQFWYSRFLMPEVPSQYFLWSSLVAASASLAPGSGLLGAAAGIGLGVAGLMRLDTLGHIIAALALWKVFAPADSWPAGRGFLPAFGAMIAWTGAHQVAYPTHYSEEASDLLRSGLERLRYLWRQALRAVGLATAALVVREAEASPRRRGAWFGAVAVRAAAALTLATFLALTLASTRPDPTDALDWLALYLGWPALAAAVAGTVLWWSRASNPAMRFALALGVVVLGQLFYDPRVTPAALWAIRRFVPVALPVLLISAALLLATLARRRAWLGAVGLAVLVAGLGSRNALVYRQEPFENSIAHARVFAALIPPRSVAIFDPNLAADTQLHITLWALQDTPTYALAADMREPLLTLRRALPDRPLYWIGPASPAAQAAIGAIADPIASYRLVAGRRRLEWYELRDDFEISGATVWIYRLRQLPAATGAAGSGIEGG